MYTCKHCGQTYSTYTTICSRCGNAVVATPGAASNQSPYSASAQQQYSTTPPQSQYGATPTTAYSSPTYSSTYSTPSSYPAASSGAGKAQGIVGMILSIHGIIGAFFAFIYAIEALEYMDYYYSYYAEELGATVIGISIVFLAFSIVGMVLSSSAIGKGNTSGVAKAGKIMGIISTITCGITFFLGIIVASA